MVAPYFGISTDYETTVEVPFCSQDIKQKEAVGDNSLRKAHSLFMDTMSKSTVKSIASNFQTTQATLNWLHSPKPVTQNTSYYSMGTLKRDLNWPPHLKKKG